VIKSIWTLSPSIPTFLITFYSISVGLPTPPPSILMKEGDPLTVKFSFSPYPPFPDKPIRPFGTGLSLIRTLVLVPNHGLPLPIGRRWNFSPPPDPSESLPKSRGPFLSPTLLMLADQVLFGCPFSYSQVESVFKNQLFFHSSDIRRCWLFHPKQI